MAKTIYFESYVEFLNREDKSLNGTNDPELVSNEDHGNTSCWNCAYCSNCRGCIDCCACKDCYGCVRCVRCDNGYGCVHRVRCDNGNGCDNCIACIKCERCKNCECCENISFETGKESLKN